MGIFDINIKTDNTDASVQNITKHLQECSKEVIENGKNSMELKGYKPQGSLLKYNLKIIQNKEGISVEGELLNTLIITVFIVLGILFTYGLLVVIIIGYVYYQKRAVSNYLKALFSNKSG